MLIVLWLLTIDPPTASRLTTANAGTASAIVNATASTIARNYFIIEGPPLVFWRQTAFVSLIITHSFTLCNMEKAKGKSAKLLP
jgi:hypothetical protein